MSRVPISVLISDIHFNLNTLERASASLLKAQFKAVTLKVPLVIAGDTHDSKANMRAEVTNRLIELFSVSDAPETIVLIGNHCMINEKSQGKHALNFLKPFAIVVDTIQTAKLNGVETTLIPYQSTPSIIKHVLEDLDHPVGDIIIMHQGVHGSASGEYAHDKTAIPAEWLAGRRVISGHYHTRQQFALPAGGLMDYIGNPYTLGFGEAQDPAKGFQVLYSDGSLEFIPINLPKHVVGNILYRDGNWQITWPAKLRRQDFFKVKVVGPNDKLSALTKEHVAELLSEAEHGGFSLEFEPIDVEVNPETVQIALTGGELFDSVIDSSDADSTRKERLKKLWRSL